MPTIKIMWVFPNLSVETPGDKNGVSSGPWCFQNHSIPSDHPLDSQVFIVHPPTKSTSSCTPFGPRGLTVFPFSKNKLFFIFPKFLRNFIEVFTKITKKCLWNHFYQNMYLKAFSFKFLRYFIKKFTKNISAVFKHFS